MKNQGLTLLEVVVIVVVIGILAALLIPPICGPHNRRPMTTNCQNNLRQLYVLGTVYARSHRGQWPAATGEDLWLSFRRMTPPLIEADHASILHCSVLDHELGTDETNYRGPSIPFSRLGVAEPLGADKEGNHGEGEQIHVLLKDATVLEVEPDNPLYGKCRELLSP